MRRAFLTALLSAALAGCAALPAADDAQSAQAEWPALLPLADIFGTPVPETADPTVELETRAAQLKARAAALAASDL